MPLARDEEHVDVFRIVRGESGRVRMRMEFVLRFGYGRSVPWVRRTDFGLRAVDGPDALELHTDVELKNADYRTVAEFTVGGGSAVPFALCWHPSHRNRERNIDPLGRLKQTEDFWREWSGQRNRDLDDHDPWSDAMDRSLITLKGLTYEPTGGMVAAATTSLPEELGGERNWDYRYCWIRDATLTLYALLTSGYRAEAQAWREWMLRAAAGHPSQLQIMYGLSGERRLNESTLDWLQGYENSQPVRIGNGAYDQLQIDVYGELMDALHVGRKFQLDPSQDAWRFQKVLLKNLQKTMDAAGQGDLGDPQRRAALHPFEADGLGRLRPRREGRGGFRPFGPGRRMAKNARAHPHRDSGERLERPSQELRADLWKRRARRFAPDDPARRLSPGERSARDLDRRSRAARPDGGWPAAPLPARPQRRRPRGPRRHFPRLQFLALPTRSA